MKENNAMRLAAMALLIGVAASANAETYYKIGVDGSNESSFNGTFSEKTGWAKSRNGEIVPVIEMGNSDFIIQSGTTVRTPSAGGLCEFGGKSLVLETGGTLMTKGISNNPSFDVRNLVAQGGILQVNENRALLHTFTGSISIVEDSSLTVHLNGDEQQATINSELTGDDSTTLYITTAKTLGDKGQVLEISDADKFYGTIEAGSKSAEQFTLKLTGGFGGTITSLPLGTTKLVVNYDGVPSSTGLRIAATSIPSPLKSSVVFYSAAGIKGEKVLMTFPEGTTVNADEFSIYTADGVDGTRYPLYFKSVENEDGTVSLVTYSTYYKKGYDENKYTSFNGDYTGPDNTVGWSDTRNLASVVSVKDMATSVFVVNGQRLRTPIGESNCEFKGKALVLEAGGVLMTKSGGKDATYTLPNLIGNGGGILFNDLDWLHTIAGNISIVGHSSLNIALNADEQNAVVSSEITGDTSTTLYITTAENKGTAGQVLEISDAAEFYGTIKGNSKIDEPFILKLTGGLGGTIASLPAGTTKVLVNYEELGDAGLRIGTTEIPEIIKTGVTFYADRTFADGTVLMTFPEGIEVNPADFNVYWSHGINGNASRFVRLATVENEDGTVSLVKSSYGTVISFR